jgi:hypothetical protein
MVVPLALLWLQVALFANIPPKKHSVPSVTITTVTSSLDLFVVIRIQGITLMVLDLVILVLLLLQDVYHVRLVLVKLYVTSVTLLTNMNYLKVVAVIQELIYILMEKVVVVPVLLLFKDV